MSRYSRIDSWLLRTSAPPRLLRMEWEDEYL